MEEMIQQIDRKLNYLYALIENGSDRDTMEDPSIGKELFTARDTVAKQMIRINELEQQNRALMVKLETIKSKYIKLKNTFEQIYDELLEDGIC